LPQVVVVVVVLAPPDLDLSAPSPLSATGPDREVGGEEILGAEAQLSFLINEKHPWQMLSQLFVFH